MVGESGTVVRRRKGEEETVVGVGEEGGSDTLVKRRGEEGRPGAVTVVSAEVEGSGAVVRRGRGDGEERRKGDGEEEQGEGEVVKRGRSGLARKHSRASSLDRREIFQKYIHTDRSVTCVPASAL